MSAQPIHSSERTGSPVIASSDSVCDASGSSIFSVGDVGEAHVMAHRFFDEGRSQLGRRWLGRWLERNTGRGSDWVHLEFHMVLFELETGNWDAAHARFLQKVLPVAETSELALTDGPALCWRLALRARSPVELPWPALRKTALRRMMRPADSFVTLHNLLALAGAGDEASIRHWLCESGRLENWPDQRILDGVARAFSESIGGKTGRAAGLLRAVLPELPQLGGSRAQNLLFFELESSWRRSSEVLQSGRYVRVA